MSRPTCLKSLGFPVRHAIVSLMAILFIAPVQAGEPILTNPEPWSMVNPSGPTVRFEWTNGGMQVSEYWVEAKDSVVYEDFFYNSGSLPSTTNHVDISGIPSNDGLFYIRLWYRPTSTGSWEHRDFGYLTQRAEPQLLTPAEGSVLPGSRVHFTWTSNGYPNVTDYHLEVGTSQGAYDIASKAVSATAVSTTTVSNIPTNGQAVYVRFWWYRPVHNWSYSDYIYTAAVPSPSIGNVEDHSTLRNNHELELHLNGGASPTAYWIYVGSQWSSASGAQQYDLHSTGELPGSISTYVLPSDILPNEPQIVYIRLWYRMGPAGTNWESKTTIHVAHAPESTMTHPADREQMVKNPYNTHLYQWSPNPHYGGVRAKWLDIGSSQGSGSHYSQIWYARHETQTISGLPTNGQTLYHRQWTLFGDDWFYRDTVAYAPYVTTSDIDGDRVRNENDPDIDGDGIRNADDQDVDGDFVLNGADTDDDGDGTPDNSDTTKIGPTDDTHHLIRFTYDIGESLVLDSGDNLAFSQSNSATGTAEAMVEYGEYYYFDVGEYATLHVDLLGAPYVALEHGTTNVTTTITTGQAESKELNVHPVEVRVQVNGTFQADPSYLPGYESGAPKLHTGNTFNAGNSRYHYGGPQALKVVVVELDSTQFANPTMEITEVTSYPGYASNGIDPALEDDNNEDFSFSASSNERDVNATTGANELSAIMYCKDYCAACTVDINLGGAITTITIPHDANGDGLADHWQFAEIDRWNAQYPGTAAVPRDQAGLGQWDINSDAELEDSDGNGPMPAMADEGDGLTVLQEYRGYILDNGVAMNGQSHKRMSLARKELLVEVREEANMTQGQGPETNQAVLATFDSTAAFEATRDFYLDQQQGAEIDLYWVELELEVPNEPFPAVPANGNQPPAAARPNAHRWAGEVSMATFGAPNEYAGAGLVYRDEQLAKSDEDEHDDLYGPGKDNPRLYALNRHPNLGDFVKVYFPSRLGWVHRNVALQYPQGILFTSGHSTNVKTNRGVSVEVACVADERIFFYNQNAHFSEQQFSQLLDYVVAHEVGHIITPDMTGVQGHEHPGTGRLMGHLNPVINGDPINLGTLTWGQGESIEGTNFRSRWSDDP